MTDYTINPERGEVAIVLDGKTYPMRPSYEAMVAIEQASGASIEELWMRCRRLAEAAGGDGPVSGIGVKLSDAAAIVCECVKAAGKDRSDAVLKAFKIERVGELLARDRFAMNTPVTSILTNMLFGGADPKKAEAAKAAEQSEPAAT